MDKIGRPQGLIAYDTDKNILLREQGKKPVYNLIRPRTISYAVIILLVGGVMLYGLLNRSFLDMNVLRDRIPNFVELSDGSIRNGYTVKILNKAQETRDLRLELPSLPEATISVLGVKPENGQIILSAPPDETIDYRVYVALKDASKNGDRNDIVFTVTDIATGETAKTPSTFVSGEN